MNFHNLHELLRLEMLRLILSREITGTSLAEQTGFRQSHISNYLNRKRALSLEGLDRLLAAQNLTIEKLLSDQAIADHSLPGCSPTLEEQPGLYPHTGSKSSAEAGDGIIAVPIVSSSSVVGEPEIRSHSIIETIPFYSRHLGNNRSYPTPKRANWQRFVATRPDHQQIAAMKPLLTMGCIVVIDRHYNSFTYNGAVCRADTPPLYAIRNGGSLLLRAVEFNGGNLILRASSMDSPTQLIPVAPTETLADYLLGRVCMILSVV